MRRAKRCTPLVLVAFLCSVVALAGLCVLSAVILREVRLVEIFQAGTPLPYVLERMGKPDIVTDSWEGLRGYTKPHRGARKESIWVYHHLWFRIYVVPDKEGKYIDYVYWGRT